MQFILVVVVVQIVIDTIQNCCNKNDMEPYSLFRKNVSLLQLLYNLFSNKLQTVRQLTRLRHLGVLFNHDLNFTSHIVGTPYKVCSNYWFY